MKLAIIFSLAILLLCPAATAAGQTPVPKEAGDSQEWEQLQRHFSEPRSVNLLNSGMWTLVHAGESKNEVNEVLKLLTALGNPFAKQDVGGARGFKDRVAVFLNSGDYVAAGFAATLLAISGDARYAPAIARLLERKDPPERDEEYHYPVTSRGRAAVALSLLGAREYIPKFVTMLRSRNSYDRSGAALALGHLGAKEHAKEVAALLGGDEFKHEDDDSPVYALVEMGVTSEYAAELAKVLGDEFREETAKAAAYALAGIGARQYASDVAKLLERKYMKGDAAKALALMGADEHKGRIAQLLDDEEPLVRKDAILALGVLNAREYIPRVAKFLKDPSFVSNFAAEALVLMEAGQYARECVPLVEKAYESGLYLGADEFHPLAEEQLGKYRKRFAQSFLRMTSQLAK